MLDDRGVKVKEERQSRKAPLTEADARRLLSSVSRVVLARGKSRREIAARDAVPDDLKGPTGAFRAPMVRRGKTLLVGFSREELEKLLGG